MEASRFSPAARVLPQLQWPELAIALLASLSGGLLVASTGDVKIATALAAAVSLLVLGVLSPTFFVAVFLVVRPLADGLSENHILPGVNAAALLALLVIAVALVVFARPRARTREPFRIVTAFWAVLVLSVLAGGLALVNYAGEVGTEVVGELARLGSLLASFLLGREFFRNDDRVRQLFVLVGLSAVIPAGVGLYQWVQGVEPIEDLGFGRLEGTFFGPNAFGVHLAVCALILIALPREALSRPIRLAALAPILFALFETYSRAGWATFVIGLILLGLREQKLVIVTATIGIALLVANVPRFSDRILPSTENASAEGTSSSALAWRLNNWDKLLGKYVESPLVGYGLRTSEIVNPNRTRNRPAQPTEDNPSGGTGAAPHSSVVKPLVEGGPMLLAAWVALFAALIAGMRGISRGRSDVHRYGRIMFVLWVTVAIDGAVSHDALNQTATLFALFALTGAVMGAHAQREADAPPGAA